MNCTRLSKVRLTAENLSIGQNAFKGCTALKTLSLPASLAAIDASAFENIRESLYQNLVYNTSISINCTPIYYLEPNCLIKVEDKLSNINGDYVISQFSLPLAYNGTMSITAQEALIRV